MSLQNTVFSNTHVPKRRLETQVELLFNIFYTDAEFHPTDSHIFSMAHVDS